MPLKTEKKSDATDLGKSAEQEMKLNKEHLKGKSVVNEFQVKHQIGREHSKQLSSIVKDQSPQSIQGGLDEDPVKKNAMDL